VRAPGFCSTSARGLTNGPRKPFKPQKVYQKLSPSEKKSALAEKIGLAAFGADCFWRWKDRIDRAFLMKKLGTNSKTATTTCPYC